MDDLDSDTMDEVETSCKRRRSNEETDKSLDEPDTLRTADTAMSANNVEICTATTNDNAMDLENWEINAGQQHYEQNADSAAANANEPMSTSNPANNSSAVSSADLELDELHNNSNISDVSPASRRSDTPVPSLDEALDNEASTSRNSNAGIFDHLYSSSSHSSWDSVLQIFSDSSNSAIMRPNEHDDDDDEDDDSLYQPLDEELNDVLNKPMPSYNWNCLNALLKREHGLVAGSSRFIASSQTMRRGQENQLSKRFYASRQVVERMQLSACLRKHRGCVNSVSFNRKGNFLVSGSDDTRIIVWDWARNKTKNVFKSGHTENVFQTKFIDSVGCLDIVSASRDGQVRRSVIPAGGGTIHTTCLYKHKGPVHKLAIVPQSPSEIISVGEDGFIKHKDMRSDVSSSDMLRVTRVKNNNSNKTHRVRLFSVAHHPFAPEICVCGCDTYVRIYDKRNMKKTVHEMCPQILRDTVIPMVSSAVYNSIGSEVLASYSDDHIYLFDNKNYISGKYLHRYRGRHNHRTIKGVNFFGPNSEYVISGSDCGNIFFWDKETEAIINYMAGDVTGVVNCLEPHPHLPVLATSGLDPSIKIWTPTNDAYPPDLAKSSFKMTVKRNLRRSVIDEAFDFDDQEFHAILHQFLRNPRRRARQNDDNDPDDDINSTDSAHILSMSESNSSSSTEDDENNFDSLRCRTQ